jgi:N-glycosidase YbiA
MMDTIRSFDKGYAFLSNFYPAYVIYEGEQYATVEHAFQASKYSRCSPLQWYVQDAITPNIAKKRGRMYPLRSDWDTYRLDVMLELVRDKFTRHTALRDKLLATGNAILQEGNTWNDMFWGIHIKTGKGCNHLGRILMKVRKELQIAK